MAATAAATTTGTAAAVAPKFPSFCRDDIELWFLQVDAVFRRCNVTASSTKYDHVISCIPSDTLSQIRAVVIEIVETDASDKYERLRAHLTDKLKLSNSQRAQAILDHPALGDRRPSAMLDAMRALLPSGEQSGEIFREIFLRKLPAAIRDQLGALTDKSISELAAAADRIHDSRPRSTVAAAAAKTPSRSPSPRPDAQQRGRQQTPGRQRTTGRGRQQHAGGQPTLCWYHATYAAAAKQCRPGCTWAGNGQAAAGHN